MQENDQAEEPQQGGEEVLAVLSSLDEVGQAEVQATLNSNDSLLQYVGGLQFSGDGAPSDIVDIGQAADVCQQLASSLPVATNFIVIFRSMPNRWQGRGPRTARSGRPALSLAPKKAVEVLLVVAAVSVLEERERERGEGQEEEDSRPKSQPGRCRRTRRARQPRRRRSPRPRPRPRLRRTPLQARE